MCDILYNKYDQILNKSHSNFFRDLKSIKCVLKFGLRETAIHLYCSQCLKNIGKQRSEQISRSGTAISRSGTASFHRLSLELFPKCIIQPFNLHFCVFDVKEALSSSFNQDQSRNEIICYLRSGSSLSRYFLVRAMLDSKGQTWAAVAGVPGMPRHIQSFAPAFTKDQVST